MITSSRLGHPTFYEPTRITSRRDSNTNLVWSGTHAMTRLSAMTRLGVMARLGVMTGLDVMTRLDVMTEGAGLKNGAEDSIFRRLYKPTPLDNLRLLKQS